MKEISWCLKVEFIISNFEKDFFFYNPENRSNVTDVTMFPLLLFGKKLQDFFTKSQPQKQRMKQTQFQIL